MAWNFPEGFSSASVAASGIQYRFPFHGSGVGRIFYRVDVGGRFPYTLAFQNRVDGTLSDGTKSRADDLCGIWQLESASVGRLSGNYAEILPETAAECRDLLPLRFQGKEEKTVYPGEIFFSDPIPLTFSAGDYLCLELHFSADHSELPGRWESVIPSFRRENGRFVPSLELPLAVCVAAQRPCKARIGYLGDSITQGIGTGMNRYENWCAVLSQKIGWEYSHWNLGLGFGRAADAAQDGIWLAKAKACDAVTVCYGVNDLYSDAYTEAQLRDSFERILFRLKDAGVKVFLQTVPPFHYSGRYLEQWLRLNAFLTKELAPRADGFLDVVPVLSVGREEPWRAMYGDHPDKVGCAHWANALETPFRAFLKKTEKA